MVKTVLFVLSVFLQTQPADDGSALMNKALTASGFKFTKSASGLSYTVDFDHPEGKTQRVYVAAASGKAGGYPFHSIYGTSWTSKEQPSPKILEWVSSQVKKLGQFYVFKDSQGMWAIRFSVPFDASEFSAEPKADDPGVTRLKDTIYFVDQVADEASKELAKL